MYTLIRKYITGFASNARGELVMFGLNSLNIGEEALSGMTNKSYCRSRFLCLTVSRCVITVNKGFKT